MALRQSRRARAHPGFHLLLPDALPVPLGEPARPQNSGRGGRSHAGARRCAARGRRHRGDPRRADRRLRARRRAESARAELARVDRAVAEHPALSRLERYPPHGGALGLCAAALFAAPARRHRRRHGAHLLAPARDGAVRDRLGASAWNRCVAADGGVVPADAALLPGLALVGSGPARYHSPLHALHAGFRLSVRPRKGRRLERARAGESIGHEMTAAAELRSGKGHRDENFPVASWLIDARHRGPILAFYEFVRVADDIADHPTLSEREKLDQLDRLEKNLLGEGAENREAVTLRTVLAARALSPRHAQDLLTAFRLDVTKLRYRDWDDLMSYCAYSAMPVGRFVLDVHGESRATWAANDALCAALQINNHLQDCGKDYRALNRVYIPLDAFAAAGAEVEELGAERASPALAACVRQVAARNAALLAE